MNTPDGPREISPVKIEVESTIETCRTEAKELFYLANELAKKLNKDGKESEPAKAAEALGLNGAVVILGEYADSIESMQDINVLQQAFTLSGRAELASNFYSIVKAVYSQDPRFQPYIQSFEKLISAINANKPTRPFILPAPMLSKFDESTMMKDPVRSFFRKEVFDVRSVHEAMNEFCKSKKPPETPYDYIGSVANPGYENGYKMQVTRINPSDWYYMLQNFGRKRNPAYTEWNDRINRNPFAKYRQEQEAPVPEYIESKLIEF
jgi:hypothetical protein